MTMQQQFRKYTLPVAAAAVLAVSSAAFAGTTPQQSAEKKVDCKKTPDHKDCKNMPK